MRILTWNLFHGRAVPDEPRELLAEFGTALASWDWDVALLQEVPPWWAPALARTTGSGAARIALTSRNALPALRRGLARWRPDLLKSNGGGANVILVRGAPPLEHRSATLRLWPERRVVHAARLADGAWIANVHAQVRPHRLARADLALAGVLLHRWARPAPGVLVLGGDCNVPDPAVAGLVRVPGARGVDHFLCRGLEGRARALERGRLSDHRPMLATLAAA